MWLLEQSFTNLEFLCICKDEVINCWSKADDMFVQLLKMKLDNNFFNIPFQKKIIKEIIKKQKLNKRLK